MVVGHAHHLQLIADRLLLCGVRDLLLFRRLIANSEDLSSGGFTSSIFKDLLLYLAEAMTGSSAELTSRRNVSHAAVDLLVASAAV